MANIRDIGSPNIRLTPSSAGPRAVQEAANAQANASRVWGAALGEGIAGVGAVLEEREKQKAQEEIIQGSTAYGLMMMNLSQQRDEFIRNSDPNDTTAGRRFMETIAIPQMEKFREGFQTDAGRRWAAERSASGTTSLFNSTTADVANRAAIAAVSNIETYANSRSQYVFDNPEDLSTALQEIEQNVPLMINQPGIDPTTAAKVNLQTIKEIRRNLIENAIAGEMERNPEGFIEQLDAGEWDKYAEELGTQSVNGIEYPTLEVARARAQGIAKSRDAEDRAAKNQAWTDAQRLSEETKAGVALGTYDLETDTYRVTPGLYDEIRNNPDMTETDKLAAIEFLQSRTGRRGAQKDTPGFVSELVKRASLPETDPNHLSQAELLTYVDAPEGKAITQSSYNFIKSILSGSSDQKDFMATTVTAGIAMAAQSVNPKKTGIGGTLQSISDLNGGRQRAEEEMAFDVRTRLMQAPDLATQRRMMTPGNKEYIFTKEYIDGWVARGNQYAREPLPGSAVGGGLLEGAPTPPADGTPAPTPAQRPSVDDILFGPASVPGQQSYVPAPKKVDLSAVITPEGGSIDLEPPETVQQDIPGIDNAPTGSTILASTDQFSRKINDKGYGERVTGSLTVNGKTYQWGSGGGGRGSLPFGTYKIERFTTGQERKEIGFSYRKDAFMISDARDWMPGTANDPARRGLLIHSSSAGRTAGCIGIQGGDEVFQEFVQDMKAEIDKRGGSVTIVVGPQQVAMPRLREAVRG